MARYNFDMSEYQQSKQARRFSQWEGCDDLSPVFHESSVSYFPERKKLCLAVTSAYEFEAVLGLCYDLELPIPEAYQEELDEEELERRRADLQKIREKFGPVFEVKPPDPLYPFGALERGTNAFSGTEISIPLGEGILNFCYADFNSAFERCAPALRKLTTTVDAPAKIHSAEEGMIYLHELYVEVFTALSEYSILPFIPPASRRSSYGEQRKR